MGQVKGINVVVGIPSFGMVSTYFLQARTQMQFPLVSSAFDKIVLNKPIAAARNEIVEFALSQNANYIFWLDDDVIAPGDSFLKMYTHNKDIINGVYWSKSNPPMPLLFRGHLDGPYWNWHVGDLIEIDAAGNGLTLVKTDVYRRMAKELPGPWYSTEYHSFAGANPHTPPTLNNTEDIYFYWKARKLGYKIWADTSVQALHYEKGSKTLFGMPPMAPQAQPAWEIKARGDKLIADIGSGPISPYFEEGEVVSFDIREDVKPDVICDVRKLPVPDQTFDIIYSSHTLEHFPFKDVDKVIREWSRILKVGGELRLVVPNLQWAAKHIVEDNVMVQDMWVLYGEQDYPKNMHAAGFTPKLLEALIKSLGIYENVEVSMGDINGPPSPEYWNLYLRATKARHPKVDNVTPEDIDPSPEAQIWLPMRVYDNPNVRTIEAEIEEEKAKFAADGSKKARASKDKLLKKVKEKEDGLESSI